MGKKIVSIEAGIWWTKVALMDYKKSSPKVYQAFAFRTPEHAIEDGYIRDKESFETILIKEMQRHGIKEREVVFTLSSSKIVTREVVIPAVKDNKISGIIEAQMEEYFPMDVSDYVVSYNKMTQLEQDGKKQLKLLLVAVPDSLLNNYDSFAEHAGLRIETFDYIGNSAVQLLKNSLSGNSIVVQLEEQATVISILDNKKVVFQRITPYGYGNSLASVMDYDVFGVKDEYEAFSFLLKNEVLFSIPSLNVAQGASEEERNQQKALLEEACADLREALSYHLRVVNTALDYYQNQIGGELRGQIYLIGDGARLAGMQKFFEREQPMPVHNLDYSTFIEVRKFMQEDGFVSSAGFLTVAGAGVHPIDVRSKEKSSFENKKVNMHSAYITLAVCILFSVVLVLVSSIRQLAATSEQDELQQKISSMSYVEKIYDEQETVRLDLATYVGFDYLTKTNNEKFLTLIADLEKAFPKKVTVESLEINGDNISLNLSSPQKLEAAKLLMNLKEISYLTNISIPSMARSDSDSGVKSWQYTIMASYSYLPDIDGEEQTEDTQADGQETGTAQ